MKWMALTCAVIALVLLAWLGSEAHFRGCVEEVGVRYPAVAERIIATQPPLSDEYLIHVFTARLIEQRAEALAGCSRWP